MTTLSQCHHSWLSDIHAWNLKHPFGWFQTFTCNMVVLTQHPFKMINLIQFPKRHDQRSWSGSFSCMADDSCTGHATSRRQSLRRKLAPIEGEAIAEKRDAAAIELLHFWSLIFQAALWFWKKRLTGPLVFGLHVDVNVLEVLWDWTNTTEKINKHSRRHWSHSFIP